MFVRHFPSIWTNRRGIAYVLRHPRAVPLITAINAWVVTIILVATVVGLTLWGANQAFGYHPPNYWCKNVAEQPQYGCQKDQVTVNVPPQ